MTAASVLPKVGDRCEARRFGPITRTDFVKYQGASGDFHPIHHDDNYARAAGFPSVFSVGMFQAGLLATYATDWLGPENVRRFTVRFEAQCWPDDVLTCEGVVSDVSGAGSTTHVTVDLICKRQTGETAVTGTAVFEVAK